MPNYDLNSCLSPIDFELLTKDLLEAEFAVSLENFSEGRDQGIDLRYAPIAKEPKVKKADGGPWIVQCKRYSSYSKLKSNLKISELPKIEKLRPNRYILATSCSLNPSQTEEIKTILAPFVLSTGDVFGKERLNAMLKKHPEVERRNIKLWVGSSSVLDSIINAGTHIVSKEEVERTVAAAKIFVQNPSFDEALAILKEHHVCIISGLPGIGKTTLARMLLLYFYEKKFDIIKIESDITEARSVGFSGNARFYYYDDFLGQTGFADKLNKNEDQKLLDFMQSVKNTKHSLFVLTTREYILNQAKIHYEKFDRHKFDYLTCIVDLSKYSRKIRAEILYNHLYFSDLSEDYITQLIVERAYIKIIDHPNYSPRLIERLTSDQWIGGIKPERYSQFFLEALRNPTELWEHPFRNQIADASRNLLFTLTSLPVSSRLTDLEKAFVKFNASQFVRHGGRPLTTDFRIALKELDGTFINVRLVDRQLVVSFQNPSIRDFMNHLVLAEEALSELIESVVFFDQVAWLSEFLFGKSRKFQNKDTEKYRRAIADAMIRTINSPGCGITITGLENPQIEEREWSLASRLGDFAHFVEQIKNPFDQEIIEEKIGELTRGLAGGKVTPASCTSALELLDSLDYLSSSNGIVFLRTLKIAAVSDLSTIDDFETLGEILETLPGMFTVKEMEKLREEYKSFALCLAEEYENGDYDDDPEEIREQASRLGNVSNILTVDSTAAEEALNEYADKKESENEVASDWSNLEDRGGSIQAGCSEADIDSMFKTLGGNRIAS